MKRIKNLLIALVMTFTVSTMLISCATPAEAQVSIDITPEAIMVYGTPYWYNGSISYYFYNGRYWYPYYVDGILRFLQYDRPMRPRMRDIDRRRHEMHNYPHHRPMRSNRHQSVPNRGPGQGHNNHMIPNNRPNHRNIFPNNRPTPHMRPNRPQSHISPSNGNHNNHFGGHNNHFGGRR